MSSNFLTKDDLFHRMVAGLKADDQSLYAALRHNRVESCYVGRTFILYKMRGGEPVALDNVQVLDYYCDDASGASAEVRSANLGRRLTIGYKPVQVFSHPVMMWMPLFSRSRWCATPEMAANGGGSLGFDLVLRSQSHISLREEGVVHIVTGPQWAEEFGTSAVG